MKITYLHQYFLTPAMAGGTRSYELARRLVRAGHQVEMITSDQNAADGRRWRESTEDGVRVRWANVRYGNEMAFLSRLAAFARFAVAATRQAIRTDADVIFATSTPLTIAIPALIASRMRGIPFVFEVRDLWPDVPIAMGILRHPVLVWLAKRLELTAYRRAAHVVALAPGMRDDIVAKGIPAAKITVIPNGCDLDLFWDSAAGVTLRDQHEWLSDRKLILYAGTLGKLNGAEYLPLLAKRVAALDPEIRFVIIGKGAQQEFVRATAEREGVLGRNLFMFPAIPKRDLAAWLQAADLIVALFTGPRAAWKDGVQNKFFDALAAGKPIANNFDGWQTHIAEEAGVGVRLDPVDLEAAARELVRVLDDESWLSGVPERALVLARGRFNRDHLARQLEVVLTDAAGTRS